MKIEPDSSDGITEERHDEQPRPYSCTVCWKWFTTKQSLSRHEQLHAAAELYTCSQCQKQFATQCYLNQHMNVHSSKYKCTECGKCFHTNKCLKRHRRIHSGEKPFECTVCSKQFTPVSYTHLTLPTNREV